MSMNEKGPDQDGEKIFMQRLKFLRDSMDEYDPVKTTFLLSEKANADKDRAMWDIWKKD